MTAKKSPSYPIAVTGSIACGKSRACTSLAALARQDHVPLAIFSVDEARARLLQAPEHIDVQEALFAVFGDEIRDARGGVNRRRLSDITFWDRDAMRQAERITDRRLVRMIEEAAAEASGLLLVEWALIAEKRLLGLTAFNAMLVTCSPAEQLRRLAGGDLPEEHCRRRMALQLGSREKRARILRAQAGAGRGDLYELDTETWDGGALCAIYRALIAHLEERP